MHTEGPSGKPGGPSALEVPADLRGEADLRQLGKRARDIDGERGGARRAGGARTRAEGEARASECRAAGARKALAIAADATGPAQLDSAIEETASKLGGLDALVTLVGGSHPGGTADLSDQDWRSAYERNLWPAVRASRSALPPLAKGAARRGFPEPPARRASSCT